MGNVVISRRGDIGIYYKLLSRDKQWAFGLHELIVWDKRLNGFSPTGDVYEVDENKDIQDVFRKINEVSEEHKGNICLKIMAHGYESYYSKVIMGDGPRVCGSQIVTEHSQGGFGIQFCKEYILHKNINLWKQVARKMKKIIIYSCGAAYITPGSNGGDGDGNVLCYRLAQNTGAYVRASTASQMYWAWPNINFSDWEGVVLDYGPAGNVVDVFPKEEPKS